MRDNSRSTPVEFTRRDFVRGAAGVLALRYLPSETAGAQQQHFAYVASSPNGDGDGGAICVLSSAETNTWSTMQRVPSRAPAYLLHARAQRMLYVANEVAVHESLPRGTVEAFRIHPVDGTLTLVSLTPLSLSATRPRSMALSPDGKLLAVAAYGGGIYNLLPVAEDGSLGPPSGIFKEVGCGPHAALQASAHPHTLLFDRTGKHLLCSDFGSDRIHVFAVESGRLIRKAQRATGAGSGPGICVLHPAGFLYALHGLGKRIVSYRYDPASGTISEGLFQYTSSRSCTDSIALHPSGQVLYATDEHSMVLEVWRVDARSGKLAHAQDLSLGKAAPTNISVAPDGESVYILDSRRGSMMRFSADPTTGKLCATAGVATVHAPSSIAVHAI